MFSDTITALNNSMDCELLDLPSNDTDDYTNKSCCHDLIDDTDDNTFLCNDNNNNDPNCFPLLDLPPLVLVVVLGNLTAKDVSMTSQTCGALYRLSQHNGVWKRVAKRKWGLRPSKGVMRPARWKHYFSHKMAVMREGSFKWEQMAVWQEQTLLHITLLVICWWHFVYLLLYRWTETLSPRGTNTLDQQLDMTCTSLAVRNSPRRDSTKCMIFPSLPCCY